MFRQDFTCPALLEDIYAFYLYRAITYFGSTFQRILIITQTPLGWSDFARHYFRSLG